MSYTLRRCAGASGHRPAYAEVDRHHIRPKYLAYLLKVPISTETVDLCSGCHDLAHHILHHLINTGTLGGHRPPTGVRSLVDTAWDWYQEQMLV